MVVWRGRLAREMLDSIGVWRFTWVYALGGRVARPHTLC
jgi:hypothetical protein